MCVCVCVYVCVCVCVCVCMYVCVCMCGMYLAGLALDGGAGNCSRLVLCVCDYYKES